MTTLISDLYRLRQRLLPTLPIASRSTLSAGAGALARPGQGDVSKPSTYRENVSMTTQFDSMTTEEEKP